MLQVVNTPRTSMYSEMNSFGKLPLLEAVEMYQDKNALTKRTPDIYPEKICVALLSGWKKWIRNT
jgi:hypothetical protein